MTSVTCVLLGVAEVKLPLRRLPPNKRVRVANIAHRAVLAPEPAPGEVSDELEEQRQAIGVIDAYYALDEVTVQIESDLCEVKRGQDVVVMHKVRDVIIITPIKDIPTRVVYISRNDSFGRAAVVLQMRSSGEVEKLLSFFPEAVPATVGPTLPSNELQVQTQREPKSSWSKGMGKKFTSMFASLTTSTGSRKSSPKAPGKLSPSPDTPEPPTPEAVSSSDSEDELESNPDDTDCQSEGKYYEDMGLDANVQERLYDDSIETLSRNSSSSAESNSLAIECELRFFLESDKDFVKTLQSLEDDREQLAGPDTPQFIRENLTLLFMQVKSLIRLHTELHSEFQKSGASVKKICEAITRHQDDYESYVYFMENIPIVDRIIQDHMDYFKVHMPELPEKLRKPRMRLHYYVLTLETIHKKCSISAEKQVLQKAMEILKVPLKKADSKLFLGAVTGSPFDISDLGNLIRHSDLQLRKGGDLPRRTYHVLVLQTLLILTVSRGRNYQYVTSFRMDQVGLGKLERGVMFTLHVRNGPRGSSVPHVFKAKNINVQQQWINVLKEILSERVQTVNSRNSAIEGESGVLSSVRRSKVRRGQSFEKSSMRIISPTPASDSDDIDEERPTLGRSVSDGSHFGGRHIMIKKSNSSILSRNKPLIRQQSATFPSANQNSINWKNSERLPPLTIEAVFPSLQKVVLYEKESLEISENHCSQIATLADHEKKYVHGVNEQLGTFLNDEFSKPPPCIINHMRALYAFHSCHFAPLLLTACDTGDPEEIARCFTENAEEFLELYTVFLADRARYDEQMKEMDLRNIYLYPVLHFELYFKSLTKFKRHDKDKEKNFIEEAIEVLHQCALESNRILLTETISGAPFDLGECGPVLHEGKIKVRQAGMILKQEMYVVLLNTLILLLEPRIPCYKYIDSIRMDTVGMGPSPDSLTFQLEVRTEATKTLTYSFRAPSKAAKSQWESEITKLLNKQVELLKERLKKRLGDDEGNMKYIEMKGDTDLHRIHPRLKTPLETSL
ncbi:uncharacterized protein [Macrobrachium rosenbergii]|uniref:uncharacterized protein n=1 Tax=Macrobrachium rosenbergii TaxID=79674 RepID=UPI0034D6F829